MDKFQVIFYKGDYKDRQEQANRDDCDLYVEQHLNSVTDPTIDYACVITRKVPNTTEEALAKTYCEMIHNTFGNQCQGVIKGGFNGRGSRNISTCTMPSLLLEPLFISNRQHVDWLMNGLGIPLLAVCLADTIKTYYKSGTIGFSVGHKYKTSNPDDRGAKVPESYLIPYLNTSIYESDICESILLKAKNILEMK